MNTKTKTQKPVSTTPRGLRTALVALLIVSAVSGYAVNTYFFFHSGTAFQSRIQQTLSDPSAQQSSPHFSLPGLMTTDHPNPSEGSQLDQVRNFIQQTAERNRDGFTITFNGTMKGKNGTVALVNKKALSVGSELEGVRVVAISNNTLTIEYEGDTQELTIGQTVTVELR